MTLSRTTSPFVFCITWNNKYITCDWNPSKFPNYPKDWDTVTYKHKFADVFKSGHWNGNDFPLKRQSYKIYLSFRSSYQTSAFGSLIWIYVFAKALPAWYIEPLRPWKTISQPFVNFVRHSTFIALFNELLITIVPILRGLFNTSSISIL